MATNSKSPQLAAVLAKAVPTPPAPTTSTRIVASVAQGPTVTRPVLLRLARPTHRATAGTPRGNVHRRWRARREPGPGPPPSVRKSPAGSGHAGQPRGDDVGHLRVPPPERMIPVDEDEGDRSRDGPDLPFELVGRGERIPAPGDEEARPVELGEVVGAEPVRASRRVQRIADQDERGNIQPL